MKISKVLVFLQHFDERGSFCKSCFLKCMRGLFQEGVSVGQGAPQTCISCGPGVECLRRDSSGSNWKVFISNENFAKTDIFTLSLLFGKLPFKKTLRIASISKPSKTFLFFQMAKFYFITNCCVVLCLSRREGNCIPNLTTCKLCKRTVKCNQPFRK